MFSSRVIGITVILALASVFAFAQTSSQPAVSPGASGPPKTGAITGQVVDENGQPLKDVLVQVRANGSKEMPSASTDREGQFQIKDLAPADYDIFVSKPAYLADLTKSPNRPYRIGDTITLTLIKGGVVTGKVLDANGNPVTMVNVRAQIVRRAEGQPYANIPQSRPTDDRGIYRIYGLPPGTYVVYAGGPDQFRDLPQETIHQFDVPTYAPSSNRENAAEIDVRMGEEVADVDIRYRGEQGRTISGEVTVPEKAHAGFSVMFATSGPAGNPYAEASYQRDGKRIFLFKGVADGDYSLIAQSYSPDGELAISEPKQVTVQGADVTGIQLTTKMMGSVTGRLVLEATKVAECNSKDNPLSIETLIFAKHRNDESAKQIPQLIWSRSEPPRPDEKGNFLLRNLAPGAYYFAPILRVPQWYVQSIVFGPPASATAKTKQIDATRVWTNIKLGDSVTGLTITLAQGGALFRGQMELAPGERAPEGSVLFLVPVEREKATDVLRFFGTNIQRNGYFEVGNIAPGRYWLLVQTAGEDASAKVRLPNETELRAQIRRLAEAAKTEIELKPCQEINNYRFPPKP